ncbi:response regulator transcription factor [Ruminiclostridium cellobioparum]|uniref:Stage 0 sporulation protein A homolog n=1 Tax=Ruminiclostridium cellobioparum subsp. termitidis CT1112 TaxID=1195236 RepID=S0FLW7_RUMCE|nr:response regulator transcription factor [Ruminiclostridium cellobioparum]EMS73225.1 two component transcriptional regulator, winged helix family protein [Ruminiclostridium cellobioparum subsp. termitidis CT1112]
MSLQKKILVVDDEQKIVDVVKSYLEHSGYEVYTALNGNQALAAFEKTEPTLIILDLMLPDISGEEICKNIRKKSGVPIIMLTARADEEDILKGLEIGADDYILKPFSPRQLVARVAAVLRRAHESPAPVVNVIELEDIVVDDMKHEVKKKEEIINLTPNEYKIFFTMLKYPNKTFTREELITMALGDDFEGFDRTVDTHIKNLRQKIEDDPRDPRYLQTVHGIGYRLFRED